MFPVCVCFFPVLGATPPAEVARADVKVEVTSTMLKLSLRNQQVIAVSKPASVNGGKWRYGMRMLRVEVWAVSEEVCGAAQAFAG